MTTVDPIELSSDSEVEEQAPSRRLGSLGPLELLRQLIGGMNESIPDTDDSGDSDGGGYLPTFMMPGVPSGRRKRPRSPAVAVAGSGDASDPLVLDDVPAVSQQPSLGEGQPPRRRARRAATTAAMQSRRPEQEPAVVCLSDESPTRPSATSARQARLAVDAGAESRPAASSGAQVSAISSSNNNNADGDDGERCCPICLDDYQDMTSTICGHVFCRKCIRTCIFKHHQCPSCRKPLRLADTHRLYFR